MAKYAYPRKPDYVCEPCGAKFCKDEALREGLERFGPGGGRIVCPNCKQQWGVLALFRVHGLDCDCC